MVTQKRGRRTAEGRVLKANNAKTRVIAIDQRLPHELYGRIIRSTVKFVAHDEKNESQVGDLVRIQECRPMSRTKRWRLIEILERNVEIPEQNGGQ
jgi:small subunit ribosomal protein S17